MKTMKKTIALIMTIAVLTSILLTGCGGKNINDNPKESAKTEESAKAEQKKVYPLEIKDDLGRTVNLEKKPEKIAVLSGTFLGIHYETGGAAIARSEDKGSSIVPEAAKSVESIGAVYNIDMEKLVSLNPDFVIGQVGLHDKFVETLEAANIPTIMLSMKTYDDVKDKLNLFGQINDNIAKSDELIKKLEDKKEDIVKKLPNEEKKVAILYVSSKDVSLKLDNSIAGNVASILNLKNIASGLKSDKMDGENVPFSIEKIVENDPDIILVTTMVKSKEMAEEKIKSDLESNPAWNGLNAVKEGKIYYLPQDLFLHNPGERFGDSIEYMAKVVYPDVYGKVEQ